LTRLISVCKPLCNLSDQLVQNPPLLLNMKTPIESEFRQSFI